MAGLGERWSVLVVGLPHLSGADNGDLVQGRYGDVTTPAVQAALDDVVERLAAFGPTKVAVEQPPSTQAALDHRFAVVAADPGAATSSEVEQLGFRLARRCGLVGVHGVDVQDEFWDDRLEPLVTEGGSGHERFVHLEAAAQRLVADEEAMWARSPLAAIQLLNEPSSVAAADAFYAADLVPIVDGDGNHPGAAVAGRWYRRNARIAANLHALADAGDRIVVLYGGSHVGPLLSVLGASPEVDAWLADGVLRDAPAEGPLRYASTATGIEPHHLVGFFEGWSAPATAEQHVAILRGSSHVEVAWLDDVVVGFVTAISDGVIAAYIPLLEVLPEHRGKGIGGTLVRRLLERLRHLYMVDVLCDDDVFPFYEQLGFAAAGGGLLRRYDWNR